MQRAAAAGKRKEAMPNPLADWQTLRRFLPLALQAPVMLTVQHHPQHAAVLLQGWLSTPAGNTSQHQNQLRRGSREHHLVEQEGGVGEAGALGAVGGVQRELGGGRRRGRQLSLHGT